MEFFNLFVILCSYLIIFWLKIGTVKGIIGGSEASIEQFKYMVSIQVDNIHICGGAIIGEWHVLTAAHCFITEDNKFENKKFTVVPGARQVTNRDPSRYAINIDIIYVPKEFKSIKQSEPLFSQTGDLAVIKLKSKLTSSENYELNHLTLPRTTHGRRFLMFSKEKATLVGFGRDSINLGSMLGYNTTTITHEYQTKLKSIETTIVHKTVCKSMFPFPLDVKHICAQITDLNLNSVEGACDGDTGSPLVLKENTVIGILSQHRRDCNEQYGGSLYTRVSSFIRFIDAIMLDKALIDCRIAAYKVREETVGSSKEIEDLLEVTEFL